MQTFGSMTTGPSSYFVMASTGQTEAQTGNSQCMQLLRPQIWAVPSRTGGSMVSHVDGLSLYVLPRGSSFQSLQASTHWRQPMQVLESNMMARGWPSERRLVG